MSKIPDETKDPKFQGVVQHFLKTKPQPFTPKAKPKATPSSKTSPSKGRGGKA
jgi:hypothetical protein